MTSSRRAAVLVIDSDRKNLAWVARVVRTVVAEVRTASYLDPSVDLGAVALVVANYDGLSTGDRQRLFEASSDPNGPRLLLMSSAQRREYENLFVELERHDLTNVLAHDTAVRPSDLIVTIQKITRGDIFGLDKYFGWGVEPFTIDIASSADLARAVDHATQFASDLEVHPRLIENLATVAHELATNAVYNAPVGDDGAPRFAHLPRTADVSLRAGEEVSLTVCCDGQHLGVAVTDCFGAMTREKTLAYLSKCLRRDHAQPAAGKGGAGLGLYMTFDSVNHLVVNIGRGRRTEVIGIIDVRGSYRDFASRGKSFNVFVDDQASP